jgi:hypothetical protein
LYYRVLITYITQKDKTKQEVLRRTNSTENEASNNSCIAACVSVAAVIFFTDPLPNNDRRFTYNNTQNDGRDL